MAIVYTFELDTGGGFTSIAPPVNFGDISLQVVFNSQSPSAAISGSRFDFDGTTAQRLRAYFNADIAGGYSIFSAPRLRITDDCGDFFVLDLDLISPNTLWECDSVKCAIRQSERVDWFDEITQGVTFSYLASAITDPITGYKGAGHISYSDFKKTPYCISEIPDYTTISLMSVNLFLIGWQIADAVKELIAKITDFLGRITAEGGTPIIGIIRLLAQLTGILLSVVKIFLLLTLFINTFQTILNALIQSKKYKLCMREADMWQRLCDYAGVGFRSTIYSTGSPWNNATYMPRKVVIPNISLHPSGLSSLVNIVVPDLERPEDEGQDPFFKAYGYFDGTGKEFVDEMCRKYDASCVIIQTPTGPVLSFEQKRQHNLQTGFTPPNIGEVGNTFNLPEPFSTNLASLPFEYVLQFQVDSSDRNTLRMYRGTTAQVSTFPNNPRKKSHQLTPGGEVIVLNEALAKRKEYLTAPEQFLQEFENLMNTNIPGIVALNLAVKTTIINTLLTPLIGVIVNAALGNFSNATAADFPVPHFDPNRFGWMLLSDDSFTWPKTFIGMDVGGDWQVSPASESVMSAEALIKRFHWWSLGTDYVKLGQVIAKHNQHKHYRNNTFKFCCADYNALLNSNYFVTPDGKDGYMVSLEWKLHAQKAEGVDYKINDKFTLLTSTLKANGI